MAVLMNASLIECAAKTGFEEAASHLWPPICRDQALDALSHTMGGFIRA
ncbi:hypothetical protein [Alicyclobacillus dauci]|uniref:Uncharacterized protein n=1 Tax=Alicyclobacillus dauci TaxID=1475485 RepID=A0ABY6Z4E7_9BACL|nr:hypothetical protein [Alicyclobacillus dauci]WAH36875.1 hypothetical protein NZD86_22365 [Alicyclobacillus dauci]